MTPQAVEAALTPDTSGHRRRPRPRRRRRCRRHRGDRTAKEGLWLLEDTCEALGVASGEKQRGWQLRAVGELQLLFFAPHHHHRGRHGGDRTMRGWRTSCGRCGRMDGCATCAQAPRSLRDDPHIDPRFLFRHRRFQRAANRDQCGDWPRATGAARCLQRKPPARWPRRLDAGLAPLAQAGHLSLIRHNSRVTPAAVRLHECCAVSQSGTRRPARPSRGLRHRDPAGDLRQPRASAGARPLTTYRMSGALAGADRVMDCGLYWGTHSNMREDEVRYIVAAVTGYFESNARARRRRHG